jgi:hypothetical protein
MQKYVVFSPDGSLLGAYSQVPPEAHKDSMIPVSDEEYVNWTGYRANAARDGVELSPPAVESAAQHNAPILAQLADIDAKSIRPLREGETARVRELAEQAAILRAQLRKA